MDEQAKGVSHDTKALLTFEARKKSAVVAYILWFILGWLGKHRFYLNKIGTAKVMLGLFLITLFTILFKFGVWVLLDFVASSASNFSTFVIFWLEALLLINENVIYIGAASFLALGIWLIADLFLIPGMVEKRNNELLQEITR